MKNSFFTLVLIFIVFAFSACSLQKEEKHVIFIGLDGWGAYCMEKADMPNTKQLMTDGAYTLKKKISTSFF